MLHQALFPGHMGSEKKQRWSFRATMITGVKGLRLGELGKGVGRLLGQSQQQLWSDHHGMVMAGRCRGSSGVAPGLVAHLTPSSAPSLWGTCWLSSSRMVGCPVPCLGDEPG